MDGADSGRVAQSWKLYAAAAIGALLLALTDLARHSDASTVELLTKVKLDGRVTLLAVVLLFTPLLGILAAWIYRPSTERDAFTLGFAVFSLFALVPTAPDDKATSKEIDVTSRGASAYVLIAPAQAQGAQKTSGTALLNLDFQGSSPSKTAVTVRNLTTDQWLGDFSIEDSVKLVGNAGDRIALDFKAPGYERTRLELQIEEGMREYRVPLEMDKTPLFIQRLRMRTAEVDAVPVTSATGNTGAVQ
ncbi:MAG TPA: hypothetical protein VF031_08585 [Alphaproteobacteria bacterium]